MVAREARSANVDSQHVRKVPRHADAVAKRLSDGGVVLPRSETIVRAEFRQQSSRCQCMRCGNVFTAPTPFDKHQTTDETGEVQCWEPSSVGLVNRNGFWGAPGEVPVSELWPKEIS